MSACMYVCVVKVQVYERLRFLFVVRKRKRRGTSETWMTADLYVMV